MDSDYSELRQLYRHFLNSKYGQTRWFVRIPEREKEYSQSKWELSFGKYICAEKVAHANVPLYLQGQPDLMCFCSVIKFNKAMTSDVLVRVVDPNKWVILVDEYQLTIHNSPRKFLIDEGIMENNSIKGYQLMRYCEIFIEQSGAKDFSELKKTVPLDGLPAHFQFC